MLFCESLFVRTFEYGMSTQANMTKLENHTLTTAEQIFDSLWPAEGADRCVIEDVRDRRARRIKSYCET